MQQSKIIALLLMIIPLIIILSFYLSSISDNTKNNLNSIVLRQDESQCKNGDLKIVSCKDEDSLTSSCSEKQIKEWKAYKNYLKAGSDEIKDCNSLEDKKEGVGKDESCTCLQQKIYDLIKGNDDSKDKQIKDCSLNSCTTSEEKIYNTIKDNSKKSSLKFFNSDFYKIHKTNFEDYAKSKNIDVNVLYAIIIKEGAYYKNFKDTVRFECSYFNKNSNNDKVKCTLKDGESFSRIKSETDYDAYLKAEKLNSLLAFESSSSGFAQIMGFNYINLGMSEKTLTNLDFNTEFKYFTDFLEKNNLITPIQNKNWDEIARLYNGNGYKQNNYQLALKENYNKLIQNS